MTDTLPKPSCQLHRDREAVVCLCLGCGQQLEISSDTNRVEIETNAGRLIFWIENCDKCRSFVGLPFDTTASTIVVQSIKMPAVGGANGLYFCQYCEDTYLESLSEENERIRSLLSSSSDFGHDFAALVQECWDYTCFNFLECHGPDDLIGCLHCGKLSEIDLDSGDETIACECGQPLSQFPKDNEEAISNTRFVCRSCASVFGKYWRTIPAAVASATTKPELVSPPKVTDAQLQAWAARAEELGIDFYCPTCDGECKGEGFHR